MGKKGKKGGKADKGAKPAKAKPVEKDYEALNVACDETVRIKTRVERWSPFYLPRSC